MFRNLLHQGEGLLPGGFPGIQVPAQHADDVGVGLEGPLQVRLARDLDHRVHALGEGELDEGPETRRLEQRGHQEDGVRPEDLALLDLVLLEDEVLPDERDLHGGPHLGQVAVVPVVEELVRGHGQGASAVVHEALGVRRGAIALPDLAAQRVPARHLGDDGDARLAELFLQGVVPSVGLLHRRGPFLFLDLDVQRLEYLDFLQHLPPSAISRQVTGTFLVHDGILLLILHYTSVSRQVNRFVHCPAEK